MFLPNVGNVLTQFCRFRGQISGMDREEGELPSDEEVGRRNDTIGNEEMDSDGHVGRKESSKLAETVKSLQKEVQSYKADNERMLIQLNERLMHSLSEI